MRLDRLDYPIHLVRLLADGETAYGIPGQIELGYPIHMVDAQILIGRALIYTEQQLLGVDGLGQGAQPLHLRLAADEPTVCAVAGALYIVVRRGIFDAFVKRHGDGGGEIRLYLHALLGSHKDALSVDMRREINALLLYPAELCKRKYLKSARIGEHGTVPIEELMNSAEVVNKLIARADMEVIGVRQLDLTAEVIEVSRRNSALYRGACADVHEHGGLNGPVNRLHHAPAGVSFFF